MKNLFIIILISMSIFSLDAQIVTPQPSPKCKLEQRVGLTDISLNYSRPSLKGRVIFGDLVPFGEKWRTGANESTKIKFSDDVTIEGKVLKAGEYALYTVPNASSWEVIFYKNLTHWGTPDVWVPEDVVLSLTVTPLKSTSKIESMQIEFDNLTNTSATMAIKWDNTVVPMALKVDVDTKVQKDITKALAGPTAGDYYAAGRYYFDMDKDINQAAQWVHKANEMKPQYWTLRQEALIVAKQGKYKEAVELAKKSIELAKAEKDENYVRMNTKDIDVWSKK